MQGHHASFHELRQPVGQVILDPLDTVVAVDEQQPDGLVKAVGCAGRRSDDRAHDLRDTRSLERLGEGLEGGRLARAALVRIDRIDARTASGSCAAGQPNRGLPLPRADLDDNARAAAPCQLVQSRAFAGVQPALGAVRELARPLEIGHLARHDAIFTARGRARTVRSHRASGRPIRRAADQASRGPVAAAGGELRPASARERSLRRPLHGARTSGSFAGVRKGASHWPWPG